MFAFKLSPPRHICVISYQHQSTRISNPRLSATLCWSLKHKARKCSCKTTCLPYGNTSCLDIKSNEVQSPSTKRSFKPKRERSLWTLQELLFTHLPVMAASGGNRYATILEFRDFSVNVRGHLFVRKPNLHRYHITVEPMFGPLPPR